jgi:hypothetical protein
MADAAIVRRRSPASERTSSVFGRACSFALSASAAIMLMASTLYESFDSARLGVMLVALILLHCLRRPRFLFCREFALYATFVAYMFITVLWTTDAGLGMNTLLPAVDCILVMILFGALVTYHDLRAVLAGMLAGFLAGAAAYTATAGFPFVYPEGFSYNAIAGMYLFGLFIALLFGWSTRSRILPLAIGLILLVLIAATTSIKTNLGILLGAAAASLMYFRHFMAVIRRTAIALIVLVGIVAYAVASNDAVVEMLQAGVERVTLGVGVLTAREDAARADSLGLGTREDWRNKGIEGWLNNPVFGNGVEAFRADYGITSHSTPVDLLYNSGIIGCVLFYSAFAALAWRLSRARDRDLGSLRPLIFGALVCYLFMTLSGTLHYNVFLASIIAISVALLRQGNWRAYPSGNSVPRTSS